MLSLLLYPLVGLIIFLVLVYLYHRYIKDDEAGFWAGNCTILVVFVLSILFWPILLIIFFRKISKKLKRKFRNIEGLGKIYIHEVYDQYQGEPVLYLAQDHKGYLLVLLIENSSRLKQWLYLPLSQKRLLKMKGGSIDIYTAFTHPEGGKVFSSILNKGLVEEFNIWLPVEDIDVNKLPDKGEVLRLNRICH